MSMFEINIARMAEGDHHYTFAGTPDDLGLADVVEGPVALEVDLSRRGRQVSLKASFRGVGRFTCDRCLDEFQQGLEGSYSILYLPEGELGDASEDDGEVQSIPADAQVIRLDEDLRQYILLGLPGKRLCREECRGLCPTCGTNWNRGSCRCEVDAIDPRWDALRKLDRN